MLYTLAVIAAVIFVILKIFGNNKNDVLDKVPGPRRLPIMGNTMEFLGMTQGEMFDRMRVYEKIYGDRCVVKILSRTLLLLSNPNDIEIVLSHPRNITKSKHYSYLQPWLGTGLLISTGKKWHKRRKILTPSFHFNILKNFSKVMEEKSKNLIYELQKTQGSEVDVMTTMSNFTLYTICETAMGTQLDSDLSATVVKYKKAILDIGRLIITRLTNLWLRNNLVFKYSIPGKEFDKCLRIVQEFADNVILERKKNKKDGEVSILEEGLGVSRSMALLDVLLDAESKGDIDVEGIREEVNTFMFEGHDTTAMALTFAIMLLAHHEDVQERIYDECQRVVGESDRAPDWNDLSDMKYIEAVIKEALRLYPSVPTIGRIVTEDFMLGDILVKKGIEIVIQIYDLHRREDLYPEPEVFKPDRFLTFESRRHPYAFVPFSAGLRNCIGQRFAMQEMKFALCGICRKFKILPRVKGATGRPSLLADLVLRPLNPIYVKFEPR